MKGEVIPKLSFALRFGCFTLKHRIHKKDLVKNPMSHANVKGKNYYFVLILTLG